MTSQNNYNIPLFPITKALLEVRGTLTSLETLVTAIPMGPESLFDSHQSLAL